MADLPSLQPDDNRGKPWRVLEIDGRFPDRDCLDSSSLETYATFFDRSCIRDPLAVAQHAKAKQRLTTGHAVCNNCTETHISTDKENRFMEVSARMDVLDRCFPPTFWIRHKAGGWFCW